MSEIAGELARVREAFDRPTLRLLDRKWAPFALAVFRCSFGRDRRAVPADRLHTQVEAYIGEVRAEGREVKYPAGRVACLEWMKEGWLDRTLGDDDEEQYSLTSHALEALKLIDSLAQERASMISESRLSMILDEARSWATEANPDREERLRRLDADIERLTVERDRIANGGELRPANDDRMLEGYLNLADLIGRLPSDFKRVEESVASMHKEIIADFREEERPIGEVLDEYLAKSDHLMSATAAGRAFQGAVDLLRDDALLTDLRRDLGTIMTHPFSEALNGTERREFLGTVAIIRKGLNDVLSQRSRLSSTLREHIESHDAVQDRELDALLRHISKELVTWMRTAGPRATVPISMLPGRLSLDHLRERFYDTREDVIPAPLADVADEAPAAPSLAEIRQRGGPLLAETREALLAAAGLGGTSVGEAFNTLDAELRRPIEVIGLLHMVTQIGALDDAAGAEVFDTIRPDGTTRTFQAPRVDLDTGRLAALATLNDEGVSDE
ncbi:DUF3375 domain-containing protein [Georgenia sp. SUBG003]|uniref:DUF3375 domain-containing protein n=1 Tax=Georgenia sp. SUBG003 TaxID=1497974 RepID=UPI000694E068